MKNKGYTAISLFSGAMGLDLGIEKAGFDVRVCVEFDKMAAETIRINTNTPVIAEDITQITTERMMEVGGLKPGQVNLVFGGPPCQAFSTAGARRSLDDFRGNMVVSFLRVVREAKPKLFLLENVRGLLSSKLNFVPEGYEEYASIVQESGSVVHFLRHEFEKLGYQVSFALFDSANYGVPQRRERVLMFGTRSKQPVQLPMPTHSLGGTGKTKPWVTIREAFEGLDPQKAVSVQFRDKHLKFLKKLKAGQYWKHLDPEDQKVAMGGSYLLQGGKTGFYRRLSWDKPSPALVTTPVMPATMLCHPEELRPLSVQEYARIQMFPDTWKFAGSTARIYKQIGNAVPVGLAHAAGKALVAHLEGRESQEKFDYSNVVFSRYKGTDHHSFAQKFQTPQPLPFPT